MESSIPLKYDSYFFLSIHTVFEVENIRSLQNNKKFCKHIFKKNKSPRNLCWYPNEYSRAPSSINTHHGYCDSLWWIHIVIQFRRPATSGDIGCRRSKEAGSRWRRGGAGSWPQVYQFHYWCCLNLKTLTTEIRWLIMQKHQTYESCPTLFCY